MAIVITGSSRGIGRGLRDHYVKAGKEVWGTTRGEIPEDRLLHGKDQAGGWVTLDVTEPAGVRHLAETLDSVPVDLLVCNAGAYPDKGMKLADGFPAEAWAEAFSVNVTAVFLCVQAMLPNLQMASAPKVAILSSSMGSSTRAPGGSYAYRASKAAATNLGRNLATDLEPLGIAVGIYHPGWVRTEMGGQQADIGISDSVDGLAARFAELNLETTGHVLGYDGKPVPY